MRGLIVIAMFAWTSPGSIRFADACTILQNEAFELDPAHASDSIAPGPVTVTNAQLSPANDFEGCDAEMHDSCSDLGTISFAVSGMSDDRTPSNRLGVQVTVVEGELPPVGRGNGFSPVKLMSGGVTYVFGNSDPRDYDFVLAISAIDLNGNVGPATEVRFSRTADGSGCATGSPRVQWLVLAIAALLLGRRRRC